jgi:hypothetical protein
MIIRLRINKKNINVKKKAYSLVEMLVTLVLTSIIMFALIALLSQILQISAMTYNRSKLREDLNNFTDKIEKDLRNASKIGQCGGDESGVTPDTEFRCDFFLNGLYSWRRCERGTVDFCQGNALCDLKGAEDYTLCKYSLDNDLNVVGEPLEKFNPLYNLERFSINVVADNPDPDAVDDQSSRRVVSLILVTSHPNQRLKIDNMIRQTLISTKNFDNTVINK